MRPRRGEPDGHVVAEFQLVGEFVVCDRVRNVSAGRAAEVVQLRTARQHGCDVAAVGAPVPVACSMLCEWHSRQVGRSEEHTSELTSLLRISTAVFCLKKITTHY